MFCPECKAEYRSGFTRCADCDVDLVESLDSAAAADGESENTSADPALDPPIMLWSGADTGEFNLIRKILGDAGIRYADEPLEARLLYASMRNPLEIWVQQSRLEAAKKAVWPEGDPDSDTAEEKDESSQQIHTAPGEEPADALEAETEEDSEWGDTDDKIYDEDLTCAVWSGADLDQSNTIRDCLREVGIRPLVRDNPTAGHSIMVLPRHEERARVVIQQILQAR